MKLSVHITKGAAPLCRLQFSFLSPFGVSKGLSAALVLKKLKFYVKVFSYDGQGAVRRSILYADRSCFLLFLFYFAQALWRTIPLFPIRQVS